MANIKSAKKRAIQNEKLRTLRSGQRSTVRTSVKSVEAAIAAGDKDAAKSALSLAIPVIDRIADKKVLHKNKAARLKSRLSKGVKNLG